MHRAVLAFEPVFTMSIRAQSRDGILEEGHKLWVVLPDVKLRLVAAHKKVVVVVRDELALAVAVVHEPRKRRDAAKSFVPGNPVRPVNVE